MELKERMEWYRTQTKQLPEEIDILETVQKSKDIFYQREQERMLTYLEFLWVQFMLVKKRWWFMQLLILVGAGMLLFTMQEEWLAQRTMGIAGVLFIVFAIPELWKNRENCSMEIEASAYYSLRQIYAARMLLFGMADFCLLTIFSAVLLGTLHMAVVSLLLQFIFPMVVTACICFGMLCSKFEVSESTSIVLCFLWCVVWWMITINEQVYTVIVLPVWMILLCLASAFLAFVVYRTLQNCSQYLEVTFDGIEYR